LEKQVNKLSKKIFYSLIFILFIFSVSSYAQEDAYVSGTKYFIKDITTSGNGSLNKQTIVTFSGLRKGQEVSVPGEETSNAIKKLWASNLFSDVNLFVTKVVGNSIYLNIEVKELPALDEVKITGIRKSKQEDVVKENKLKKGVKVTENLLTTTKNYLQDKYAKEGYLSSKVYLNPISVIDTTGKEKINLVINIDKGDKVKISDINFSGNESFSSSKLRKKMKNTKEKGLKAPLRIFKRSKFVKDNYKEDIVTLTEAYREKGFRDVKIKGGDPVFNDDETISLNIDVSEGKKYYIGNIEFTGNTVYTDKYLKQKLGLYKGDIYNAVLLEKQVADNTNPDADDITNLYQNNGYMFSNVTPVETGVRNDTIDFEIRISEGKLTYFKNISVTGNDKTNDHVVYRELRTKPGQVYSKQNVIRSLRELGQMGFFDAEQLVPNIKNPNPNEGTVDVEYSVVEKGSSQIQLQGGYGGGGFIGTLGLTFNNFSIKNIFNKDAYQPLPMGDGQSLSLRASAAQTYQTYSLSFMEPWLGGKKPQQFSVSFSYSRYFRFNNITREIDRDQEFGILGVSLGLAKRLKVPDDFFTLSQSVSLQHYNLKNYQTSLFQNISDGYANSLAYTIGLSRDSRAINPIFPERGSKFALTGKFTFPYSLVNGVDYKNLENLEKYKQKNSQGNYVDENNNVVTDFNDAAPDLSKVDQERYKWLEFYKIKFEGDWYSSLYKKLILRSNVNFGFVGAYNDDRGVVPFERFSLGGSGLGGAGLQQIETVRMRGYPDNGSLSSEDGGIIFNRFSLELRHPISMKSQTAQIYALAFVEAGNSFDDYKDYNPFDMYRSAGAGVRINMAAFGLLGIDFAHGFDALPGQTEKNGWETHFILGREF
jgi:outer membrane protein insertion porin family